MPGSLAGLTVLVVEDDPGSREMMAAILEFHGVAVLLAHDGTEALGQVGVVVPDLIITDIKMPGTTGIDFLRAVRGGADPQIAKVPIIGVTGVSELAAPMWDAGFDDVLVKPVRAEALKALVLRHVTPPPARSS